MAEPTLLPERLQYRPTKIELDESIEKAKATLLKNDQALGVRLSR